MLVRIQKWGNSLGLRIPKAFADEAGVRAGTEVDLSLADGCLVARPLTRTRYRLRTLIAGITARNRHGEVDTGEGTGREAW